MPNFTDQTGRSVFISSSPQKIISLVPSQTELLSDLGLDASVVGITKFCRHPLSWFRTKRRVGGTKNPRISKIIELSPDLIIGNKEENRKEDIELLAESFPVWLSDVNNLYDALEMIETISTITGTIGTGKQLITKIDTAFDQLRHVYQTKYNPLKVCYLIWQDPFIAVGNNSFIHDMLQQCGFINVFDNVPRYPTVTIDDIRSSQCDYIFLSSEPYPFKEKHLRSLQPLLPSQKVILVDGEMFSWYGSRLLQSAVYFQALMATLQHGAGAP